MLQLFRFKSHQLRTFLINNEVWFVVMDVAVILDYANPSKMLAHVDDEDIQAINPYDYFSVSVAGTFNSKTSKVAVINESGLDAVTLESTKPETKVFRKWVFEEVLPSIRVNGISFTKQNQQNNQLPQRDTIDYIKATIAVNQMEDSVLTRLLRDSLVDEISMKRNQGSIT